MDARVTDTAREIDPVIIEDTAKLYLQFLQEVKHFTSAPGDEIAVADEVRDRLKAVLEFGGMEDRFLTVSSGTLEEPLELLKKHLSDDPFCWGVLLAWVFVRDLGKILMESDYGVQSRSWIDEWLLGKIIGSVLVDLGFDEQRSWHGVALVKILTSHQSWNKTEGTRKGRSYRTLRKLLVDQEVQQFIGVNRYQDILWFNQEAFESLLGWLLAISLADITARTSSSDDEMAADIAEVYDIVREWRDAGEESGFRVEALLEKLKG
jgi:hypothetical protein